MLRIASALAGLVCAAALVSPAQAQFDPFRQDPLYANSYGYQQAQPQVQGQPGDEYRAQVAPIPRQLVSFDSKYSPGTIVISTEQRRLYYVTQQGEAISYGVGVGRPGFEWSGVKTITSKREWPSWTPPVEMLRRRPDLPRYMSGGLENPLGARAMYLGGSLYRIHGSNEPDTIGQAVSSGCIRMTNDDVIDLYSRAKVGTKVVVLR
jgi:lipoprotein-anchoring transpeptidase ErfK/SrfK